ncbi:hypothetical protein ACR79N_00670 [Sphingobacterium siyangense]|uniref:Uncharacterized protein n=1 Tax=Sphingobacterium siyangense TaxID=459529 RepID=A0A562M3M7_9SPHI|nr:hypothetical protein [Sphingobacterium siyangense]TWI14463.1 hypothetical protein IQ31_05339 [Sphingobacterium siyangense]
MIFRYLLILSGLLTFLHVEAQHFLEKSFNVKFIEGAANQVAYLQFPTNVRMWGTIEIQVTGGYNNQLNRGVLTKRIDIVYNGSAGAYLNQESDIIQSSEPLSSYWSIGDFDKDNARIAIYHLNNRGNEINVKVKIQLIQPASITSLTEGLFISEPVAGTGGQERQYRTFSDARIGIGTKSPEYKLDIVGTARAHSILVNTQKTADFVFDPAYQLPALDSLKAFITDNRHLPGIPSARQMEKEGINVGDLQIDLLQKIEELTLYVIEQDKVNKKQQEIIDALIKEIKK